MPDESDLTFPVSSLGSRLEEDLGIRNRKRLESVLKAKIFRAKMHRGGHRIEHKFGMIYVLYLGPDLESAVLHRNEAAFNIVRWFAGKDHKDTIDAQGHKVKSPYNEYLDDLRARWYNVVPELADLLTDEAKEYEPLV